MKEKKRDAKGWLALGLAALSLFLVVYGPKIKERQEEAKAERAKAEQAAKEQKRQQEKKEWFESLCSPEEGWTFEDYDRAIKEVALAEIEGNKHSSSFGWKTGGTAEELSLYDCYVTDDGVLNDSRENNRGYDFVVRYIDNNYDGKDGVALVSVYFDMGGSLYMNFRAGDRKECGDDVALFTDYLISNREYMEYRFVYAVLDIDSAKLEELDELSDGSLAHFTAEDFAALSGKVLAAEEE